MLTVQIKDDGKAVEVEQDRDGVILTLVCTGKVYADIVAKAIIDGVASFDTRCE